MSPTMRSDQKGLQPDVYLSGQRASSGPRGLAITPPAYGIESLDSAQAGVVQMKTASLTLSNRTGLPDRLKDGIEGLSGLSLDDVRVHYNSSKPAQLQALAYTQGADIHVAPGQERHLPHEAWHVVQQKQGWVQQTTKLAGVAVNDSPSLENEADKMGTESLQTYARVEKPRENKIGAVVTPVLQRVKNKGKKKEPTNNLDDLEKEYYLKKQFSFRDEEDNEIFSDHLDNLVDGLDEDRENLRKELMKPKKTIQKIRMLKRNITEKVGELNTTQYMQKEYPELKMILGYQKGTGIDQVYEDEESKEIFVVEAKGPGAKSGMSDRKGKQMSLPWVELTAKGMSNTKVKKKILKAIEKKRMVRLTVFSTPSGNAPRKIVPEKRTN